MWLSPPWQLYYPPPLQAKVTDRRLGHLSPTKPQNTHWDTYRPQDPSPGPSRTPVSRTWFRRGTEGGQREVNLSDSVRTPRRESMTSVPGDGKVCSHASSSLSQRADVRGCMLVGGINGFLKQGLLGWGWCQWLSGSITFQHQDLVGDALWLAVEQRNLRSTLRQLSALGTLASTSSGR